MSGFLKIMSGENKPDHDPYKGFELHVLGAGSKVQFKRNEQLLDVAVISNPDHGTEEYLLTGNAYVLSESGKSVASHGTNVPNVDDDGVEEVNDATLTMALLKNINDPEILAQVFRVAADCNPLVHEALVNVAKVRKIPVNAKEAGELLGKLEPAEVSEVFSHAQRFQTELECPADQCFVPAVGEYLADQVKQGNRAVMEAVRNAASYLPDSERRGGTFEHQGMTSLGRPHS